MRACTCALIDAGFPFRRRNSPQIIKPLFPKIDHAHALECAPLIILDAKTRVDQSCTRHGVESTDRSAPVGLCVSSSPVIMAAALLSTSALSSMEAMLNSLMGRPSTQGGGDDIDTVTDRDDALDLPLPPLPVRPAAPRGRRPSRPQRFVAAAEPSSPSPLEEESIGEEASALAELERKATMAEARLRQKEEENAALRRRIESYHVRWLEYEFKIKSMEETFHEQMASLQMAQDSAEMRRKRQEHYAEPPHTKTSEEASARLRHGGRSSARRSSAVGRLGAEFRRQSQSLESGAVGRLGAEFRRQSQSLQSGAAAAVVVGGDARPPQWQPGAPSANGDSEEDELIRLKARFRAWKKDYKVRLRKAKAEIDKERRRRSSCWIPRF